MEHLNPTQIKRRLARLRAEQRLLLKRYREISPTIWLWAKGDRSEQTIEKIYALTDIKITKPSLKKRKK